MCVCVGGGGRVAFIFIREGAFIRINMVFSSFPSDREIPTSFTINSILMVIL